MSRRENTFRIDYSKVPRKPSYQELHHFVGSVLGLTREDVARIQTSRSLGCAFVKVRQLEVAQRIVAEHDNKHSTEVDGKAYPLRILLEDGAVEVKLTDLSEDVTNECIIDFLSGYGEVLSIHELMWDDKYLFGGIPTGVRVVRMMVHENIPSFVTIDGETTSLFYFGQQQTCKHCSEFVHNGITCVQNKKLLVQKSYANVTKQTLSKPGRQKQSGPKPTEPKVSTVRGPTNTTKDPKSQNAQSLAESTPESLAMPPPATANTSKTRKQLHSETDFPPLPPLKSLDVPAENSLLCVSTRRPASPDGIENETDESSTSASSRRSRRRPPGKKPRNDLSENTNDGDVTVL